MQQFDNVLIFSSVMQQLNTVVIINDKGTILIDPGFFPGEIQEIQQFLEQSSTSCERLMVLTHSHYDHIAGAPYFPNYRLAVSQLWDRDNEKRSARRLEQFDSEFYVERPWPRRVKLAEPSVFVNHQETLGPIRFFHTPGHTLDSLSLLYENILIVGDYLSSLEFPFINKSFASYETSLTMFEEIIAKNGVSMLISQHGPPALSADHMSGRIYSARDYIKQLRVLVDRAAMNKSSRDDMIQEALTMKYQNRAIPPGLVRVHQQNLELLWTEVQEN